MKKIFLGWTGQPFLSYINALTALGASVERESIDNCDALLLPGGGDIHPRLYGQLVDGATEIDEARDNCELVLLHRFLNEGKPILGICRGMQLINVAFGGTLRQHVEKHSQIDGTDRLHRVCTDNTLLRSLYGEQFQVNSAHHQAVDRPGHGLRVIARAEDGIIEAIRHESYPVLGVQWHPERFHDSDRNDGWLLLDSFLKSL